ncbi:MAG: flagellar filament capping protein FliD [Betaproteobacteria bacterium]
MKIPPASVSLDIEKFKSQALGSLTGSASSFDSIFASALANPSFAANSTSTDPLASLSQSSAVNGLTSVGRNTSLADPESAYKMMTLINQQEVLYKAQFSELSQMKNYVAQMEDAGRSLGSIATDTGNDSIKTRLQGFADQYNSWIQRFSPDMQSGGLLAGTQAAQVSVYELEQSVQSIFNGAYDGLHGLGDLGISINPYTHLISLDTAKLDTMLAANKQGAVNTVREFSANFAKSANLLNSANNFIPNQLDNLNRAIHYIADNKADLQKEFGTGDAAKPTGQIAQALAAYNQTYGS